MFAPATIKDENTKNKANLNIFKEKLFRLV